MAVDSKFGLIAVTDVVPEANDLNQLSPMTRSVLEFFGNDAFDDTFSGDGSITAPGAPPGVEKKLTVLADSGYCEADQLAECEEQGVIPIVPQPRTTAGQSTGGQTVYPKDRFHYHPEEDVYVCPGNHEMIPRKERNRGGKLSIDYSTRACSGCRFKLDCTKTHYRTITRRTNEGAVERSRQRVKEQPAMKVVRQGLVEKVFGTLRMWGYDEFLLRRIENVRGEFSMSALAYNLRRSINILGVPSILRALNA